LQTISVSDRELLQKLLGRVNHVGAPPMSLVFLFREKATKWQTAAKKQKIHV
jgi:hypothetical protein